MFSSFRAIFFLNNATYFRMISCKQPKLLVVSYFSSKGFSAVPAAFNNKNLNSSNDTPNSNEKSTRNTSKPQYVRDMYHTNKILDVLQNIDGNASHDLISSTINKINLIINEKPLSKKLLASITSQHQFYTFLSMIKVDDLKYSDLIILLALLEKLDVQHSRTIYEQIFIKLIEIHKNLDFYEVVEIHHFLKERYKWKSGESDMLKLVLEKEISGMLDDRYFVLNPKNKIAALQYSLFNPVPNDVQEIITNFVSVLKSEELLNVFKFFCKFLSETPTTHSSYKMVRDNFFQILDQNLTENLPLSLVTNFAYIYASKTRNQTINYDPQLADYLMNVAVKFNAKNYDLVQMLKASSLMRHINYNFLNYAINVVKTDSNFADEHFYGCLFLFDLLANSNFSHDNKERWSKIVSFLNNSNTLTNYLDKTKALTVQDYLYVVINLASLGIFNNESLNFLSKSVTRDSIRNHGIGFPYLLLILNEAVEILHTNYKKPILEKKVFELIFKKVQAYNTKNLVKKMNLLNGIKNCFDSVLAVEDSMLIGVNTKFGIFIDGVVAVNNGGKALSLGNMAKSREINYIEEIRIPANFTLCAVLVLNNQEYFKSSSTLSSSRLLLLKTLERMGFRTLFIFEDVWNSLDPKEKEATLRNEIFNKNRKQLFDSELIHKRKLVKMLKDDS